MKKFLLSVSVLALLIILGQSLQASLTSAQLITSSDISQKITQVTNDINALKAQKDNLIASTFLTSGCVQGSQGAGETDKIVTGLNGIVYTCSDVGDPSPYRRYLTAFRNSNSQLLELNNQIGTLNEILVALINALNVALANEAQAAQTPSDPVSSPSEPAGVPEEEHGSAPSEPASTEQSPEESVLPDSEQSEEVPEEEYDPTAIFQLSDADMALLANFDPQQSQEIIERIVTKVPDPRVSFQGPQGPVMAIVFGRLAFFTEQVQLAQDEMVFLGDSGISITNGPHNATNANQVEVRLPGDGVLQVNLSPDVILTVIAGKSSFHLMSPEFEMEVLYKKSADGSIVFLPGAIFDPVSGEWRSLTGLVLSQPESFVEQLLGPVVSTCPSLAPLIDRCLENCMSQTDVVCLECDAALEKPICNKPPDKARFCQQACETNVTALASCAAL